jgi:hypothetical protein
MTNRIEVNWKVDGFVDEQRYYCSETPIDPVNLPAPKVVLANDVRSYVDTAIEVGKTYYVRVSSVKNGVEKLSDEVVVKASDGDEYWSNVVSLLHFDVDFIDSKSATWAAMNGAGVTSAKSKFGGACLDARGPKGIKSSGLGTANFGSDDWTIECFIWIVSKSRYGVLFAKRASGAYYSPVIMQYDAEANFLTAYISITGSAWAFNILANPPIGEWVHLALERAAGSVTFYVNGVAVNTVSIGSAALMSNANEFSLGVDGDGNYGIDCYIDEFRITKGVARYTANFTPPDAPFPSN